MADESQPIDEQEIRGATAEAEPAEEVFNAKEAAKLLGITGAKLARYLEDLRLDIRRGKSQSQGLRITRADLEVLRIYHRNRADGPRFRESEEARIFSEAVKEYGRLFRSLRQLAGEALKVEKRLRKAVPAGLAAVHTLPEPGLVLMAPLQVSIIPSGKRYRASFPEANLEAMGATRDEALLELRQEIVRMYDRFEKGHFWNEGDRERFAVLRALITRHRDRMVKG